MIVAAETAAGFGGRAGPAALGVAALGVAALGVAAQLPGLHPRQQRFDLGAGAARPLPDQRFGDASLQGVPCDQAAEQRDRGGDRGGQRRGMFITLTEEVGVRALVDAAVRFGCLEVCRWSKEWSAGRAVPIAC